MRQIRFDINNGYESLLESIILQAVKDYIRAYRRVLRRPEDLKANSIMQECEDFIESDCFRKMCDLDPEELLYNIDQQVEAEYIRRERCRR